MEKNKANIELSYTDIEAIVDILCNNLDYKKMTVKGIAKTYNTVDVGNIIDMLNKVLITQYSDYII